MVAYGSNYVPDNCLITQFSGDILECEKVNCSKLMIEGLKNLSIKELKN
jgi:hypothetical protein